ncbi:MAG TPA: serine protease [Lacunisphaera sp.]|jgi:S1-C subfamily serine protease
MGVLLKLNVTMKELFQFSVFLGAAILTGCTSVSTTAQREHTIAPYRERKIGGVSLEKFLADRTTQVFAGTELIFESTASSPDSMTFHFHGKGAFTMGKAVAIDSRGYFLTAAHVVRHGPVTVFFGEGLTLKPFQARIVWCGDNEPTRPDLALIHIDASVSTTFAWTQDSHVGDIVLAVGPNLASTQRTWKSCTKNFSDGLMAGKILAEPDSAKAQIQTNILTDDLPLHPGDSGGPLTDDQGRLVGINITVQYDYSRSKFGEPKKFTSHAIHPDPDLLQQLIEKDFSIHNLNSSLKADIKQNSPTPNQTGAGEIGVR